MTDRISQVNEVVLHELNSVILQEMEFPEGTLVTIVGVSTSRDLRYARVHVSILPINRAGSTLKLLNKARLEKHLQDRLQFKFLPRLRFYLDDTEHRAEKIEDLLDRIK